VSCYIFLLYFRTIRGVGPATAAELLASVGDCKQFKNGRHLAAWIGLTPKQHGSGETTIMGGTSKRGNRELRRLLIHGARSLMNWCDRKNDKLSLWIRQLLTRMHPCKAVVAVANKLARIVWAVLTKQVEYAYGQ
jgi:transposase